MALWRSAVRIRYAPASWRLKMTTLLPPAPGQTSAPKGLVVLGTGVFAYQIIAELIHKVAQEHLENRGIHPTFVTTVLTLCWIGFIASSTSPLLVHFCFIATGILA